MDTNTLPRTKAEALRDLDYVIRLSQLHRRLYNRLHATLRFLELLGGSAGVAVAISGSSDLVRATGALLAVVACANFAFDPGARARDHARCGATYDDLKARSSGMTLEQIDAERAAVRDPDYLESLRIPSWNDMMRSHGFVSSQQPLSTLQRFMRAVA